VPLTILLFLGTACSGKHGLSKAERQEARNRELQSFASANSAALVPDIKGSAVTLDWQKALRGPSKVYAFRGWVDDIFEKGGKYFLNVSDMDDKLLWIIQRQRPRTSAANTIRYLSPFCWWRLARFVR
jgi:hypothetical protein